MLALCQNQQRPTRRITYMKTYIATDQNGKTVTISAYTESDARQQAESYLGYGNVIKFQEI